MKSDLLSNLDPNAGRNQKERQFLAALTVHLPTWAALGVTEDDVMLQLEKDLLTVAAYVCDSSSVLRTLRVDLYESRILMGRDETFQLVTVLEAECPDVIEYRKEGAAPEEFAAIAAEWFTRELRRPIELHEWINEAWQHRKRVFADTGEVLSWSDSENRQRTGLELPHRITRVWPVP